MFRNMRNALKPGGLLLLQGYTPGQLQYNTGGPGKLSHLYTADQLRQDFRDFHIEQCDEYEAELHEGPRHSGRSAVIGFVARKPASRPADQG